MMWGILVAALVFGSLGANANEGFTPLHLAAVKNDFARAEVLLKAGADPNAKNNDGYTPLHLAVGVNASKAAEVLLKAGADPNAKNNTGFTPLHATAGGECF